MKFIKAFNSKSALDSTVSSIKHGDGAFAFGVSTAQGVEDLTLYDQRHPVTNCLKLNPVNMSPVKLDSLSTKKTPVVGDILYSTAAGKLTLDPTTNSVNNIPIAICVIPEVMENFTEGDNSEGAVKTARFVSINYMNYSTPTTGSKDYRFMYFSNYGVTIGNVKGNPYKDSYVGGKWNTQQCLSKVTNLEQYICNGVTNSMGKGYCAPACCCVAYSTPGTKPGDWYLPSVGELYQIYENRSTIKEKRTALVGSGFYEASYWSSRGWDKSNEYYVSLYSGSIYCGGKNNSQYVLGFLAVKL